MRTTSPAFTILLGAMAALPPLSIDMNLPALPAIEAALDASPAAAGLTLNLFLAGFAVAQLVLGPLSDRLGRRPVLLGGLALFTAAGFGCATATSIETLVAWRFLEGAGAASGTVLAFAIVRDLFDGDAARTRFSYVTMVLSIAPIIAPTLGTWVLAVAPWRAVFASLGAAGAVLLAAVAAGLPETRRPGPGLPVLEAYARMLTHRRALGYAALNACTFGMMFAYIAGSPLVLMQTMGVPIWLYGIMFACTASGILVGSGANSVLARRHVAAVWPVAIGLALALAGTAAACLVVTRPPLSLPLLMPPLVVAVFARGLISPNASHAALEPMAALAGVASAMLGFLQMAVGAASGIAVGALFPAHGPLAMAAMMAGFAVLSVVSWRFAEGRPWPRSTR